MEINLKEISKEELIKLWENAQRESVPTYSQTRQFFIDYTKWLEFKTFGTELLNDIGRELATAMIDIYVHNEIWNDDLGEFVEYKIDQNKPDVKGLFDMVLNGFIEDEDYLKEFGITTKNKPTKKLPHLLSNVDFNVFREPFGKQKTE